MEPSLLFLETRLGQGVARGTFRDAVLRFFGKYKLNQHHMTYMSIEAESGAASSRINCASQFHLVQEFITLILSWISNSVFWVIIYTRNCEITSDCPSCGEAGCRAQVELEL